MIPKTRNFKTLPSLLLSLLIANMLSSISFGYSSLIPIKVGTFYKPISAEDLGRGFKLNVAQGEDSFQKKVFRDDHIEISPITTSSTVSEVITNEASLENSMEISGEISVSYGPISGSGSGNYVEKFVSSSKQVTVMYRTRHTAFFKRLQPGTLSLTKDASDLIVAGNSNEVSDQFGTKFVDAIVYGAQLDVAFTVEATEDIDVEEIKAELQGRIGIGPLSGEFKAKFDKKDGEERAAYKMRISTEATGVQVIIPPNPTFEQVNKIIEDFNAEYKEKFNNFDLNDTGLLDQIEPVGFMLSTTADRVESLNQMEVAILEDRMSDLATAFRKTLFWKAKLESVDQRLQGFYDQKDNIQLKFEMYDPYKQQHYKTMLDFESKINEMIAFRALPMSTLIGTDVRVPDAYPKLASSEDHRCRGLSGEYFFQSPVQIGENQPLEDMFYVGFAITGEDDETMIPWMKGTTKRKDDNGIIHTVATAETPEDLYKKSTLDPLFPKRLGSDFSDQQGIRVDGTTIGYFDEDDYVVYSKLNFGPSGTTKGMLINYAKALTSSGGRLEVKLGKGVHGQLIAEFHPAQTIGNTFVTSHVKLLSYVSGVHDVTFVAKDIDKDLMTLNWFELSGLPNRVNTYPRISATEYSDQRGTKIGGDVVGYFDNGDWLIYTHINFGAFGTTRKIRLRYGKATTGGTVKILLGSGPSGRQIAKFSPPTTSSWGNIVEKEVSIDGDINGIHDLTFVGEDAFGVMNFISFELLAS